MFRIAWIFEYRVHHSFRARDLAKSGRQFEVYKPRAYGEIYFTTWEALAPLALRIGVGNNPSE